MGLSDTHSRLIACVRQSDCTLRRIRENHRAPVWCPGTSWGCSASGFLQLLLPLTQKVLLPGLSSRASKSPVPSAIAPVKLAPGSRSCAPVHGSAGMSHSSLPAQAGKMETQSAESLQGLSQPPAHPLFPPCSTLSTRLAGSLLEVLELNRK